jgi:phage terminase large subunit-like protein
LDLSEYDGRECYGGLDLSISSDLTAFILGFPNGERCWDVFSWFWMPGERLLELQSRDGMDPHYQKWRDASYLQAPPGRTIDYEHAAHLIGELCARFDVKAIAYDRARIDVFRDACDKAGIHDLPLIEHGQGFFRAKATGLWMPGSIGETEAAIIDERIRINENPVLTWNVGSVVPQPSSIQPTDRYFKKSGSRVHIDGAVALVQMIGAAAAGAGAPVSLFERDELWN